MPITKTMTFTATPPTTGETPTTFNYNAIACWNELKLKVVPDLNVAFTEMNALEQNVNTKEASAVASAEAAVSAANFKGSWSSATSYTIGDSVIYLGITYRALLSGSNQNPTTATTYWIALSVASSIKFTPSGEVSATTVQGAIDELSAEKLSAINIHASTNKTTPVDADELPLMDSASSFSLKKLTWANIKATLQTYFDDIYANLASPIFSGSISVKNIMYKNTPVTITSWSYVTTTITLNVASHTFVAGDYIEVGGLTATTNIPNGVHLVTSVTATTIVFTYALTPTGTVGVSSATVKGYMTTNGIVDGIGVGQTWQDVTASRVAGTTYTNTTGKPIAVAILGIAPNISSAFTIFVNGLNVANSQGYAAVGATTTVYSLIPNGATYVLSLSGSTTISTWYELR